MAPGGIDFKLRVSLREGSIYYFGDRQLTSELSHYFIVVNSDPLTQLVLVLSVVTSQLESVKRRRKKCPETLVELGPDLIKVLRKPSIIDCNDLKQIPLAAFNERFVAKEIQYFDNDLPADLRRAIRRAIHASTIVLPEVKALIAAP